VEHLTSQALDGVIQMPVHLSIPALGYYADDESGNLFFTHNGIEFTGTPVSVYPLAEQYYAAVDAFSYADVCPATELPVLKRHFFPLRMEVSGRPHVTIRA
jgi:hypothetical protein